MDNEEARQRRIGFMTAIGLLLENSEPATRDEIIKTLKSFGDELYLEIENDSHASVAAVAEINPCRPPLVWDPVSQQCV
jgi:hypothetical protein